MPRVGTVDADAADFARDGAGGAGVNAPLTPGARRRISPLGENGDHQPHGARERLRGGEAARPKPVEAGCCTRWSRVTGFRRQIAPAPRRRQSRTTNRADRWAAKSRTLRKSRDNHGSYPHAIAERGAYRSVLVNLEPSATVRRDEWITPSPTAPGQTRLPLARSNRARPNVSLGLASSIAGRSWAIPGHAGGERLLVRWASASPF